MGKPRFLKSLVFLCLAVCLTSSTPAAGQTLVVHNEVKHDVSAPLRDMAKGAAAQQAQAQEAEPVRTIPLPTGFKPQGEPDLALQRTAVPAKATASPTLINNFEGVGDGLAGFFDQVAPPDTNGAVGSTQYVQWVNLSFAVFDKTTGNILPNFPVAGNTLWSGFGVPCETNNDGDIIVLYDQLNNRWLFGQFAVRSGSGFLTNTFQCVAVSTSSDATGSYNRYAFEFDNEFDDYPKMAIWPDAYYATFNMFNSSLTGFLGADACAFDGNAMRSGQTATAVCFQQNSNVFSLLASSLDGQTLPPTGSPDFLVTMDVNSLDLYKFHVDFTNTTNSTFTGPTNIPVTAFSPLLCDNNTTITCVPQPDTTQLVDSLGDRLMYRLAYRNFGTHESLVVSHSVIANSSSGIRWYEIQNPNGTPSVAQQSTYAPDTNFRWMGSMAMDVSGDIALGYSVSSSSTFPSIAVTGQALSDPRNTLQAETTVISGSGSQINGLNRWGDYSAMQVDPTDDCTFWYTTEYIQTTGSFNWNTRIANFKFPGCGVPDLSITSTHSGNFTQGQTGTYTITVTNVGGKPTDGTTVTVTDTLPTGLTFNAANGAGWSCAQGPPVTCTRSDVLNSQSSYPAITLTVNVAANAPGSVTNTATVTGGGSQDTSDNTANDPTTVIQTGPDPTISKTHTGNFIQGQTGTYTITVTNVGLSPTSGTITVSDTLPTGLTAAAASGTGWSCALGPPVSCTRSDSLASNAAYPSIGLTVNVATNAPALVTNTATVSGGGDVNPLNNTASDPTTVTPPPADLTISKSHTGNFNQGQIGAPYTITVSNVGAGPTVGAVTITDTLPSGFTVAGMTGDGWFCNPNTVICTRSDVLAVNSSYPAITLSVNVPDNAPASVTNTATVAGGGEVNTSNDTANDVTTINPAPDLTIVLSHAPEPFIVGQNGTFTITVSNIGSIATTGAVNVVDNLPLGLTVTDISATGWDCAATTQLNCVRSDALAAGSSYPAITVTMSVTSGGAPVVNSAGVNGGGEFNTSNDSAFETINVTAAVLAISKSHTGVFTVGQPASYIITVSNTGPIATVGVVNVTDFLPQGLTATSVNGAGWDCSSLPTEFLNCSRSDSLAANSSYPALAVTVNVSDSPPTVINTAQVTGGGSLQSHDASDQTSINTPSLTITKTHIGNFTVGQPGTYTITVGNTGIPTVDVVTLTDNLPSGMTATAVGGTGWNCSNLPTQFLTCTRSDVLATNSTYPPLNVTVSIGNIDSTVTNTATVTGGGDGLSHSASDATNINTPTLTITKSHTGNFTVGQPGVYTITVGNTGSVATVGQVALTDFLPSGMTATAVSGAGWKCPNLPTQFLGCSRSDSLATNSTYPPLNVTVSIGNIAPTVTNTAFVTGGGDAVSHSASDTTSISTPSLTITKSHTGNFTVGQTGVYTITVGNQGSTTTVGAVSLTDFLPSGMMVTSVSGTGWACPNLPTQFLSCTRSDPLASGSSYPALSVTVSITSGLPSVVNTASVTGGGDASLHSASDPTNVNAPTLTVAKTHVGNFTVGQPATYTITVGNVGQIATVGTVNLGEFIPGALTVTNISGTGWNCISFPLTSLSCSRSDALAPNSSYPPLTVTGTIGNSAPTIVNTVTVSGGGDALNHSATDTANVITPTLTLTKSHSGTFTVGQPGTYTITVGNVGQIATVGTVTLSDSLPSGMTATAVSGAGWNCPGLPTQFLTCTRSDSLPTGSSYPPLNVTVSIGNIVAGVFNNASVTGGGDGLLHNVSDPTTLNTPTLTITKTHSGNFIAGQTGTYTITVGNAGKIATVGTVTVTDVLPFSMTALAAGGTGWDCSSVPTSFLTCSRTDALATGSSYPPLTVIVSVAGTGASANNTAQVTGGGDALSHSGSDSGTIEGPVLSITKSHVNSFTVGQTGTYTIAVSNVGNAATDGTTVTVIDSLPPGMSVNTIQGTGWNCSGTACARADILAQGASYPAITLSVNVSGGAPGSTNQATVTGGGDLNIHFANDETTITGPTLAISKSDSGNFTVGQTGTYTITISNVGPAATAGTVTMTDFLPLSMTATAVNAPGWSCSSLPTTFLNCTRSDVLETNSSYPSILVTVSVTSGGTVTNSADVTGGGDSTTESASDTVIVNGPTLAITKTHSPDPFTVGQPGAYTITVSNTGNNATSGSVTVTDFLSQNFTAASVTGTGWSCSGTTFVSCTRSDSLAANSSYPAITINVSVNSGGTVTNTANVNGGGDPIFHSANDTVTIIGPTLAITKSHSGNFTSGQTGTYTITVSNVGNLATVGTVTVTDPLPAGLTLNNASGTGWGCTGTTLITCTRSDSLATNSSYPSITLSVTVGNSAPGVTNTATVSGGGDSASHTANDVTTVTTPTLAITKTHSGDFTVGQPGIYNITVSNTGSIATTGTVIVEDFLPFPMTATAFTGTGWACSTVPTSVLTCTRSDSLASNSSYPVLQVTVNVSGGSSSAINSVTVTGGGDGLTHNANDQTNINTPTLALTKTHIGNFTIGQTGTYTITASNTGSIATVGAVTVSDSLPPGLTATAISATGWNCSAPPTTFVNCSRSDTLAGGSSYPPITLTVSVSSGVSATVVNQATLSGGGDAQIRSVTDVANINLPDLAITKSHIGNFFSGETDAVYTINISNVGTVATVAGGTLLVTDQLAAGLVATGAGGTGWSCNILPGPQTEMDCTRPTGVLSPGSSYPPITLTLNVAASAPGSVSDTVSVLGIADANFSNNFASDPTTILPIAINPTSPTSVTVNPGTPAAFNFTANLSTSQNVGTVTFSASGLPPNSTVSFSPSSLTQTGPLTMTISTSGNGATASHTLRSSNRLILCGAGVFVVFGVLGIVTSKRQRQKWLWAGMSGCVLAFTLFVVGCGGGGGQSFTPTPTPTPIATPTPTPSPTPTPTTPPGTYTITITATSSNPSVSPASMTVTLVVQ